jgi:hypothetical protein
MHLSQPIGAGAFDGQHGMSPAISYVIAEADVSSVIACIEASGDARAMTGRETGANARPAITRIATRRRLAKLRFTNLDSHELAVKVSCSLWIAWKCCPVIIDTDRITDAYLCAG